MGTPPRNPPHPHRRLNLACLAGTKKGRGPFPSFPNTQPSLFDTCYGGYPQQVFIVIGLLTMKRSESRHIERLPFMGMAGQLEISVF